MLSNSFGTMCADQLVLVRSYVENVRTERLFFHPVRNAEKSVISLVQVEMQRKPIDEALLFVAIVVVATSAA